jgi:ketosteroid isomerase-like protein
MIFHKPPIMKTFYIPLIGLILAGCCSMQKSDPSVLITTDNAFSQMSVEKGLNAAFIYYADDSVVKMREGNFPVKGKNAMTSIYLARPDSGMILRWKPLKAEIGQANDLGYTFGEWELYIKSRDTTMYGNYITIWKRQPGGTWKYVLDAGSNTPKPGKHHF